MAEGISFLGVIATLCKKLSAEVVFGAFAKGFAGAVGKEAAVQIIAAIKETIRSQPAYSGFSLTQQEQNEIERLVPYMNETIWQKIVNTTIANVKLIHSNDILLLGPTGAGKTQLYKYLTGESGDSVSSSGESTKKQIRGYRQYLFYRDTPGSRTHSDVEKNAYSHAQEADKTVLAIILAGGRLENADLGGYYLPGAAQRKKFKTLSEYIEAGLVLERDYLADIEGYLNKERPLQSKIAYCMIVINKMDIWIDNYKNTLQYYQGQLTEDVSATSGCDLKVKYSAALGKEIWEKIQNISRIICKPGINPTFHGVASTYASFPQKTEDTQAQREPPSARLSRDLAKMSRDVLQAEFRSRIHLG